MTRVDIGSLAHSKWNCKYHVVFAPKYRRMIIYNHIKTDMGKILRRLCEQKGVEIIEAEACPDHSYADINSAKIQRVTDNGISKRKKFPDDIRSSCRSQV